MSVRHTATWEGRQLTVQWVEPPSVPPRDLILQVSGLCFTAEGWMVLVAGADRQWALPGGHPEPGETVDQALVREVWEEACTVVHQWAYLGVQQVDDPASPTGPPRYYQARYWARRLVAPSVFLETLAWGRTSPIASVLFKAAVAAEYRWRHENH